MDVLALLDRPIAFHPILGAITGSALDALFLSQCIYWSKRTTAKDGWFYKTVEEWTEETTMTRREIDTARLHLRNLGILEEAKRGVPCKIHYRIDLRVLQTRLAESARLDGQEVPNQSGGKRQSNTETTALTTAETRHSAPDLFGKEHRELERSLPFPDLFDTASNNVLLDVPGFGDAWLAYVNDRKQRRQGLTDVSAGRLIKKLALRPAAVVAALGAAIDKRWRGFEWEWIDKANETRPAKGISAYTPPASRATARTMDLAARRTRRESLT